MLRRLIIEITPKTCVFDADSILYAASCLPERHTISITHKATGWGIKLKNRTEFYKWITEENKGRGDKEEDQKPTISKDDFTIKDESLIIMSDTKPRKRIKASIKAIKDKEWCKEIRIILGGIGNYRNDLWVTKKYKGNRGDKPKRFQALKDWVCDTYEVESHDGVESDDVCGWYGHESLLKAIDAQDKDAADVVTISIDKDLKQWGGWHYNYSKHGAYPTWISPLEAAKNFWCQMLSGDNVDCITGVPKIRSPASGKFIGCAKGRASTLLSKCKTEQDMLVVVEKAYKDYYTMRVDDDTCMWEIAIQEAFQMLRMQEIKNVIPDYKVYKEKLLFQN